MKRMNNKGEFEYVVGILVAIVIVIGLIIIACCVTKVSPGYIGVQYSMNGGIKGEVLGQGWHMVSPTTHVTKYSVGIEQSYLCANKIGDSGNDESFEVPTKDGKGLKVDMTFTYRFDQDTITNTFTRFKAADGNSVKESFIKPNVISWTKEVTATYNVTDVLGDKRSQLNIDITNYLKDKFAPYGIIIETASLTDINPDDVTREAIQKKVTAQQAQELAQIEAETARINAEKDKEVALIEAEKNKEKASIDAEQKKIEAQAEADAIRIKAEAEADANNKISKSLTNNLIKKIMYEQWDGSLPIYNGDSTPIIDLRDFNENNSDFGE